MGHMTLGPGMLGWAAFVGNSSGCIPGNIPCDVLHIITLDDIVHLVQRGTPGFMAPELLGVEDEELQQQSPMMGRAICFGLVLCGASDKALKDRLACQ